MVAAAEAAVEEATLEAAVLVEEEPPQAVIAAVAPTTAEAFRKSRREIIFIIVISFILCVTAYSQTHLSHTSVIPDSIIPLYRGISQENKFTRMVRMFCDVSTKADQRLQNLFTNYHNFSCRCNQHTNMMKVCKKTLLNMTECCTTAKKTRKRAIHILKDFFRDTTQRKKCAPFCSLSRRKSLSPWGRGSCPAENRPPCPEACTEPARCRAAPL